MRIVHLLCLISLLLLSGCSVPQVNSPWKNSISVASDPTVWGPLAVAASISVLDQDHAISDWARETAPIFHNQENARAKSNAMRTGVIAGMWVGNMATSNNSDEFISNGITDISASLITTTLSGIGKSEFSRPRPNNPDDFESMPSSHSSYAFSVATSSLKYAEKLPTGFGRKMYVFTQYSLAALTAWARVEGGAHYPTDILVGSALGNYVSAWTHKTFQYPKNTMVTVLPINNSGFTVNYSRRF